MNWLQSIACSLAFTAGFVPSGCASKQAATPPRTSTTAVRSQIIGQSVQGRDIECLVIGDGGLVVMMLATIHGDEAAGTPLLDRLAREAAANPPWMAHRTLVLIPVANPDGYELDRRGNANGIDLNRNFPAASFTSRRRHGEQPLSEPESEALHAVIAIHRPARIVSIHQPLACIDYDGDAASLAQAMADALAPNHRLPIKKLGAYPGSLGSYAGEDLGIPIITLELPGDASELDSETRWNIYGPMLIAAIQFESNAVSQD